MSAALSCNKSNFKSPLSQVKLQPEARDAGVTIRVSSIDCNQQFINSW